MSYTISLTSQTISKNNDDAWQETDDLAEPQGNQDLKPNSVLLQFYRELTESYPCLSSYSDDEIEDCIWADGPLINNFSGNFATLGLLSEYVDDALPDIITMAAKYGITLADPQTGEIHYP